MFWIMAAVAVSFLMRTAEQWRTWAALVVSGSVYLFVPANAIFGFLLADFLAGAIVITHPAGLSQRIIGSLFLCMVFFHVGFLISQVLNSTVNGSLYGEANRFVGWLQLACLGSWGLHHVGKTVRSRLWPARHPLVTGSTIAP